MRTCGLDLGMLGAFYKTIRKLTANAIPGKLTWGLWVGPSSEMRRFSCIFARTPVDRAPVSGSSDAVEGEAGPDPPSSSGRALYGPAAPLAAWTSSCPRSRPRSWHLTEIWDQAPGTEAWRPGRPSERPALPQEGREGKEAAAPGPRSNPASRQVGQALLPVDTPSHPMSHPRTPHPQPRASALVPAKPSQAGWGALLFLWQNQLNGMLRLSESVVISLSTAQKIGKGLRVKR